jgi:hypothetical protein
MKGGSTTVELSFSEDVSAEEAARGALVAMDNRSCTLRGTGAFTSFEYLCLNSGFADVTVDLKEGLKGTRGGSFKLLDGRSAAVITLALNAAAKSLGDECRVWNPQ